MLPYRRGLRPGWLLRIGLLVYDHLGERKLLPPTRVIDLARDPAGVPLKPGLFHTGFEFSDCRVDDARLVVLNARDAAEHSATIRTRTKAVAAVRRGAAWQVTLEDAVNSRRETIEARALVNAAGPWVEQTLASCLGIPGREHVRPVQGSHIVVPRLFEHDRAYMFQNPDGRIVFAIPYEGAHTLIGTTDPACGRAAPRPNPFDGELGHALQVVQLEKAIEFAKRVARQRHLTDDAVPAAFQCLDVRDGRKTVRLGRLLRRLLVPTTAHSSRQQGGSTGR